MGTMLIDAGKKAGDSSEEWNVLHPNKIRPIYRAYIEASSRIIHVNLFGDSSFSLETHELENRVFELKNAAVKNAQGRTGASSRQVLVTGSIQIKS